jgi:hypothetical protein
MQLSEHFTLDEFIASDTARSRGISNHPSPEMLERLKRTAARMELVRRTVGNKAILVTSGYRGPELNAAVGGVSTATTPKRTPSTSTARPSARRTTSAKRSRPRRPSSNTTS